MKNTDRQLRRLFVAAQPAHRVRLAPEAAAPHGFAARAVRVVTASGSNSDTAAWASLSRWGLGLACGVMLLTLLLNRSLLVNDWSPVVSVAEEVTEMVSVP